MIHAMMRYGLAVLAGLLVWAPFAQAGQTEPYVVVVGVSEYKDPAIKPRPHAEEDAKAVYDLLADKNHFDGSADRIKLLLGKPDEQRKSQPATRENIIKSIHWAVTSAGSDDLVFIYWVGQGAPIGDRACYFASDSSLKNRAKDAVGAAEIQQEFDKLKSNRVCVLVDVNFKGFDAGSDKAAEAGLEKGLEKLFEEFYGEKDELDDASPPKPVLFLSATNGFSQSPDLDKHGLFTQLVLEGLKGSADVEGGEADGTVTVDELFGWVRKELPKRAHAIAKKEHFPYPLFDRVPSTHYPLTKNAAVTAKVKQQLERFEALTKQGKIDEEVAKEGRRLLSRMPRLEAERKLRKQYQRLADGTVDVEKFLQQRQEAREALKLPRNDAESFAEKVLRVAKYTQQRYVKPIKHQELVTAALKGLYRSVEEKFPAELNTRMEKVTELSDKDLTLLLADARQHLGNRDDLKGHKAVNRALDAMLQSLDHYSTFVDPDQLDEFKRQTTQSFIGVGIQIRRDLATDMVRVMTPLRGSPAYKAGIKAGDIITKVTNKVDKEGKSLSQPEVTSTKGMEINDVVKKILGTAGTKVTLTIDREEADGVKEKTFEITRGRVEVETVMGVRRNDDDTWDYYLDKDKKIAYLRLTQFAVNTDRDLRKAIVQLLSGDGLESIILDLRFNPGGYLDSAVDISDLFVDDGIIVTIKNREGKEFNYTGHTEQSLLKPKLVVLVNGHSASASEIVAACIQDHSRGVIMGERSFGKGSVQNIEPLNLGDGTSQVKLTTATFWRPTGKNLNRFPTSKKTDDWGVSPNRDYLIELTPTERVQLWDHLRDREIIPRRDAPKKDAAPAFSDRQLDSALRYLRGDVTVKAAAGKKAG